MPKESTQQRLSRDKAPRVQITYDVEIGEAIETKELPFVMGVLGDYAGQNRESQVRLKDRKFIHIDQDNFDDVLGGMAPKVTARVENRIQEDGSTLGVDLTFRRLEDFEPQSVARQIEPLRQLLEARTRLSDLRNKVAGNDRLEALLEQVVRDTEQARTSAAPQAEGE